MLENENEVVVQPTGENAVSPAAETQETQETETPTPQQGETQETQEQGAKEERYGYDDPRHPLHNDWRRVQDDKHWVRQQQEKLLQPQTQPQPQQQPLGNTPEEREFYRQRAEETRRIVKEEFKEANKQTQSDIAAAKAEFGRMKVSEFRRNHSDIKPNSPEEGEIARKIQIGYSADDAYWSVMGPRGIKTAQQTAQRVVKQQNQAKKRANVETTGVSPAGLPGPVASKDTWDADLERAINEEGGFDQV